MTAQVSCSHNPFAHATALPSSPPVRRPPWLLPVKRRLMKPIAESLPKNNPQAGAQRLGAYSERAHWGEGTPEISMASKYNTGVSEGFRQAGINVELSRALLVVGNYPEARIKHSRHL
jgi:hypothetical protein